MRPPGPVPLTPSRGTPSFAASARATGVARARVLRAAGAGAARLPRVMRRGAAGRAAATAGGGGGAAVADRRRAIGSPSAATPPVADEDLVQHAGGLGLVDDRRLVRLDLDERLALRDLVAGLLQPLQHGRLLHRVRELRHPDVDEHGDFGGHLTGHG